MSYKTTIEIGVVGVGQIGLLQKSLNQVATTVDTLNKKQVNAGFNVQNLNTYNNLLQKAWQNIDKAAMGSKEELQAVRNLVQAKNNQIAAQTRLNALIAEEESLQKKIVATANAGFGIQGPARPPSLMEKPGVADALIGGSFPLLFGGGPGATVGGFAGGLVGGAMGGMAGMALSLAFSAVGQQIDAAVVKVRDMQKAIDGLSVDNVRKSFITVNAELEITIQRLIDAGKYEEARAAATQEAVYQTGALGTSIADSANASSMLGNAWQSFTGTLSTTVSLLVGPLAAALSFVLEVLNLAAKGLNILISGIGQGIKTAVETVISLLPGGVELLERIKIATAAINEEEQKLVASLELLLDKQYVEILNTRNLLDLERQRTLGRTTAEKQINAELDSQIAKETIRQTYAQKELDLRREFAGVTSAEGKKRLEDALVFNGLLEKQALKEQDIKDLQVQQGFQIEANIEKYTQIAEAVDRQIEALERTNSVRQAEFQAERAINDLYGVQLERLYQLASTAKERYNIVLAQFQQQIKAADIEYKQALAANELLLDKTRLQNTLIGLKYKEIDAEKSIAVAQAVARGNTVTQIRKISDAYDDSLAVQREVISAANDQLAATEAIASSQDTVAKAVYQTKILQAESVLAQKLMSDEIGLSKEQAFDLAKHMASVAMSTVAAVKPAGDIAAAAQSAAFNYKNLLTTTTQTADKQRNVAASTASVAAATAQAAAHTGEMARNMQATAKAAKDAFAGLSKFEGVSLSRSALEPWMQREISEKVANFVSTNRRGDPMAQYLARVAYEAELIEQYRTKLATVVRAEIRASDATARAEFTERYRQSLNAPAFAAGGFVSRPTLGLIGEGGESEYIVPESKAAGFATNYLFGERGAGAIPSSAESNSGAPIGAPVINITTGPVVEFNGERYVTVADMERAMRVTANGVIGRLRTPSARIALGIV